MADLAEEQLDGMSLWGHPDEVVLTNEWKVVGAYLVTMAVAEIRRRRAEHAAGREHVERVVREAIDESRHMPYGQAERAIARRLADQLSAPAGSHIPAPDEREIGQLRWIRGEIARFLNAEEAIAVLDRFIAGAKP